MLFPYGSFVDLPVCRACRNTPQADPFVGFLWATYTWPELHVCTLGLGLLVPGLLLCLALTLSGQIPM